MLVLVMAETVRVRSRGDYEEAYRVVQGGDDGSGGGGSAG